MRGTLRGSLVARPTPFRDGRVEFSGLRRLIEFQLENGTDGLVVAGTTGEAATLTTRERLSVIEFTAGTVDGVITCINGWLTTHCSCTKDVGFVRPTTLSTLQLTTATAFNTAFAR